MAKYVFKDGEFVSKETGEPLVTEFHKENFKHVLESRKPPQICSDIPDYLSPVTGELVSGRSQRREDLKRNDCYEIDPPKGSLRERHKPKEVDTEIMTRELNNELSSIAERGGLK